MTIDLSHARYANLEPPAFAEADLRAYLQACAAARPDAELPTVRALKAKFGGGHTRILRIRRSVAAELGREPPVSRAESQRAHRLAEHLAELAGELTPLLGVVKDKARQPAPIVDWDSVVQSWNFLGQRWLAMSEDMDGLERNQAALADRQLALYQVFVERLGSTDRIERTVRSFAEQVMVMHDRGVDEVLSAIRDATMTKAAPAAPPRDDARLARVEKTLGELATAMEALSKPSHVTDAADQQRASSAGVAMLAETVSELVRKHDGLIGEVQRLSEAVARKHVGLERATDELAVKIKDVTDATAGLVAAAQPLAEERVAQPAENIIARAVAHSDARFDQLRAGIAAVLDAAHGQQVMLAEQTQALASAMLQECRVIGGTVERSTQRLLRRKPAASLLKKLDALTDAVTKSRRARPATLSPGSIKALVSAVRTTTKSRSTGRTNGAKRGGSRGRVTRQSVRKRRRPTKSREVWR